MLVDPTFAEHDPAVLEICRQTYPDFEITPPARLAPGVYEIDHHNGERDLRREDGWAADFDHTYPDLKNGQEYFNCYGVCDNYLQILEQCSTLNDPSREFVVFVTQVRREDQPDDGGWRWHKWGEYIGTREPTMEYLYDEEHIDSVFTFHIFERKINHDPGN